MPVLIDADLSTLLVIDIQAKLNPVMFDAQRAPTYGYGKYPDVYTSPQVERMINASGPTGGQVPDLSDDVGGVVK